jgi:hypothetical protein
VPEISREFSNKLQVTVLPWRAFISALLESVNESLVIRKDDEGPAFDYMAEVFDGLIHCQELSVIGTVLLLSGSEVMGVESQWLLSVADTPLQCSANSSIRSVRK